MTAFESKLYALIVQFVCMNFFFTRHSALYFMGYWPSFQTVHTNVKKCSEVVKSSAFFSMLDSNN